MGQIKFIVSIAFIALFAVAIVTFSFQFGEDNNAAI